jgi:hypothetical protein
MSLNSKFLNISLDIEVLKAIALAWSCAEEIEYFIAYDSDPINVLLSIAMFKPIEIFAEYLTQRKIYQ